MPTTINGIGTHYYGKKNASARQGTCPACGKWAVLESYDTRLWFVFIFIPIIPLGRKRIIDQCGSCSRHFVVDAQQWEVSKQLNVSGAADRYRSQPSVETALEAHAAMLSFHEHDKAKDFRKEIVEQHPENAYLFAGLAAHLDEVSLHDEATQYVEQALALRPDLPDARVRLARRRMFEGKLDEARTLLSFLEEQGGLQTYDPGPLDELAGAFQRAGRHEEALALMQKLLDAFPQVGEVDSFRKAIRKSEKAVGRSQSILPERRFSLRALFDSTSGRYAPWKRRLAFGSIALVIVAIGMTVLNEYARRNRTIYIVSEFRAPVSIAFDGGAPINLGPRSKLALPEGKHLVAVRGAVNEDFEMEVATGYFERFYLSPFWVVNVGCASMLEQITVHYSQVPVPPDVKSIFGQQAMYFAGADHVFSQPPPSIRVKGGRSETRTVVNRAEGPPEWMFATALQQGPVDAAFRFVEGRLLSDPGNPQLLRSYVEESGSRQRLDRAEAFLAKRLWEPSVVIEWHRAYQNLDQSAAREAALRKTYDAKLVAQPNSPALLYLRGRLGVDRAESNAYFERAQKADANFAWAWMALAFDAASRGEWEQSKEFADKADLLKLSDPYLTHLRLLGRMATNDESAVKLARVRRATTNPFDEVRDLIALVDALLALGKSEEAIKELRVWQSRLAPDLQQTEIPSVCHAYVNYMTGAFAKEEKGGPNRGPKNSLEIHGLLAQLRPDDAGLTETTFNSSSDFLCASLAFQMVGNAAEAKRWLDRACDQMENEGAESRLAAAVLRDESAPSASQLDDLVMIPGAKAVVLAVLANRFPKQKEEFAAYARRLNVSRVPPYHLVRVATSEKP